MKQHEFTVRGEDAWTVPRAIADHRWDGRFDHQGDGFAVVVLEDFYHRINSSVQTTVIFELVDDATCEVTVVSGGAAAGWAKESFDADGAASRKLVKHLQGYCRANDLELDRRD